MNNNTYYNNAGTNPYAGHRCAKCGVAFSVTDEVLVCDTCGAPHHRQCWEDSNKCCVPGCTGQIDLNASFRINNSVQQQAVAPQFQNTAPQYQNAAPQFQNTAPQYQNTATQYQNTVPPTQTPPPQPQMQNMQYTKPPKKNKKLPIIAGIIGGVGLLMVIVLTIAILFFTKVLCIHKWQEATCQSPEICVRCSKERGEPAEHNWIDADCENPKKCSECGKTEGKPAGHKWNPATETSPKICSICNKSEGNPLIEVPDVLDMDYTEAQQKLTALGFDVEISYNYSSYTKEGCVMGQSILGGEMADQDETITLIVSQGKETVECPEKYEQKLEVVSSGSSAVLTLYEWDNEWVSVWSADGYVGEDGVSSDRNENSRTTPKGTFPIGFAYGLSKPETNLDFKELTSSSVWVDDSSSPYYNVLTTYSKADGAHYEETYKQFVDGYFSTNIYFENNGDGLTKNSAKPGKGSVITICGYKRTLGPTYGCVDISSSDMSSLLKHLDKDKNPVVIIS